jgi:hypothetical protein
MGDKIHDHKLKEKMEARTRSYLTYNQIKHMMVSRREPYALWDDIGSYERYKPRKYAPEPHRRVHKWWGELGVRPWEQEEAPFRNCRGPGMNPWILSTSANAPFATYHNEPMQVTVGGLTHVISSSITFSFNLETQFSKLHNILIFNVKKKKKGNVVACLVASN